jgi:hypothetical protein
VLFLEIRFSRLGRTSADDTLHELLLATWPPRNDAGRGSLDRIIDSPAGGIDR